jgi:hypothetical protein
VHSERFAAPSYDIHLSHPRVHLHVSEIGPRKISRGRPVGLGQYIPGLGRSFCERFLNCCGSMALLVSSSSEFSAKAYAQRMRRLAKPRRTLRILAFFSWMVDTFSIWSILFMDQQFLNRPSRLEGYRQSVTPSAVPLPIRQTMMLPNLRI